MEMTTGAGAVGVLRSLWTAVAVAILAVGTVFRRWLSDGYAVLLSMLIVAWAVAVFFHAPRFCRGFFGRYDGQAVTLRSGVWWRRQTRVPLSALRTFEVWAPPFHRLFGCRTVVLRFAGGSVLLPLLSVSLADALTDRLEGKT